MLGGWVAGWLGGWEAGWLGCWVAGRLGGWVAGRLGGWGLGGVSKLELGLGLLTCYSSEEDVFGHGFCSK